MIATVYYFILDFNVAQFESAWHLHHDLFIITKAIMQPFQVEINHASEVDEIFDSVSYNKGAAIIRMLQSYLGASPFQVRHNI